MLIFHVEHLVSSINYYYRTGTVSASTHQLANTKPGETDTHQPNMKHLYLHNMDFILLKVIFFCQESNNQKVKLKQNRCLSHDIQKRSMYRVDQHKIDMLLDVFLFIKTSERDKQSVLSVCSSLVLVSQGYSCITINSDYGQCLEWGAAVLHQVIIVISHSPPSQTIPQYSSQE